MPKELSISNKSSNKVVFFGSGPVAAKSLELLSQDFEIEYVVTKPTTLKEMTNSANGAVVYTVSDKKELDELFATLKSESTVGILIDFGIIVSNKIIEYFPKGIVNSHFSLLPNLRGPDPISFAILEGLNKTGVSLMLLVEAMDEGPVLATGELNLDGTNTTPELTNKLIQLSYELLKDALPAYLNDTINPATNIEVVPRSQEEICLMQGIDFAPTYTRKLDKKDGNIDWFKPASQIDREIRAYLDWPKSRTNINGIDCVITEASVLELSGPTEDLFIHDKKLAVYCGENALLIEKIKPAGKKEMDSKSFLAGYRNKIDL